jgi:hypothetical protein
VISATNALASSDSDRIIAKGLEFILKDRYGNDAMFPGGCHVVCRLTRHNFDKPNIASDSLPRKTPQFLDSILSGHTGGRGGRVGGGGVDHLTAVPMTQYSQQFPKLELFPTDESVGGDGLIEVTFELQSRHQLLDSKNIEKFSFLFHYTTDEDRALQERQYREEISPYQQELEQLLDDQRRAEMEYHSVKQQLREITQRADGLLLGEYLSTSQLTQSDVSSSSSDGY